jgi:hypothetical protein
MIHARRWVIAGIFVVALFAVASIRGKAQGGDIPYGQTVTGSLKAGVIDTWHFIANTGDQIAVSVERTSGNLVPMVIIEDPAQQPVAGSQAAANSSRVTLSPVRLSQSGSFLIQVSGEGQSGGEYKLTLSLVKAAQLTPTPAPTLTTNILAGTIDPGVPVQGEISKQIYRQLWSFHGNFGDVVDIRMARLSGDLDSTLTLISPIQDIVAANNSENGGPDAGILGFQLPYTGTYTIIARREGENIGQGGSSSGQYVLTLSSRGSASSTQNTTLTPGVQVKGRISDTLPTALYRLDVGGAIAVALDLSSHHRMARIRVLDTSGNVLTTQQGLSPFLTSLRLPDTGPFLIEATSLSYENNSTTDFGLTTYRLSANIARSTADPLPIQYGEHRVSTVKGVDNWFFRGNEGDIISLNVTPDTVTPAAKVRVSGPQDVLLYQGDLGAGMQQSLTLAANGIYEIEVRSADERINLPYSIEMSRLGTKGHAFGLAQISTDRGALTAAVSVTGTLAIGGADAWWLDGTAGQIINISATPTTGETTLGLALRRPDGTAVEIQSSDRVLGAVIQEVELDQTGRYRVEVFDAVGNHGGGYSLQYEDATGGRLEAGKSVKGFALPTNGYSRWAFGVSQGTLINVRLSSLTPQSWKPTINIVEPGGRVIASTTPTENSQIDLLGIAAPISGTYHLVVGGQVTGTIASYNVIVNVQAPFSADENVPLQVSATSSPLIRYEQPTISEPVRVSVGDLISPPVNLNAPNSIPIPPISYGTTVRGEIAAGAFAQSWQLGTIQSQTISFTVTSLAGTVGPDLTLVNQEGKVVHRQLHADDPTTVMNYRSPIGGTHRLIVQMGIEGGRYMLTVNPLPVALGDLQIASGKPMVYGQTQAGEIVSESAEDHYYFLGTSNDVVSLNLVTSTGNLLPAIELKSPRNEVVAFDRNTDGKSQAKISAFQLTADGMYTIIVKHNDNSAQTAGSYFLYLGLDNAFRLNNRGGGIIQPGQTVSGELAIPDTDDTWLFQGHSGERVTFIVDGLSGALPSPLGLRLQDTAGRTFTAQDITLTQGAVRLQNVMLPYDGIYRIQVTGASDKSGLYRLSWVPERERVVIGALRYNQTVNGIFRTERNTDAWVFSGTAGDVVAIALEYERGTPFKGGFQLVYENGVPLSTVADIGDGLGARAEGLLLPFSGSYTLYVANPDPDFKGAGVYGLSVDLQESKARSIGSILHYGEQGAGTLYVDDSSDTWVFSARAGDTLKIAVLAQDQFLKPTVELRTPAGTLLASAQANTAERIGKTAIDSFRIQSDGIYIITVTGSTDRTTGSYQLSLDYSPPPLAENAAINYGESKEGLVADNRPRQLFPFAGREGDIVSAKVSRESGSNLNSVISIETIDGRVLSQAYANGGETAELPPFKLPRTDQYVLVVGRYLGPSGQTVGRFAVTFNGTSEPRKIKGNVGYGQQAIGRLGNDTTFERITFDGKAGDVVGIASETTSGDLDTKLTLESSSGVVLATNDDFDGTNAVISSVLLPADDTYTVTISRVGTATIGSSGNYNLIVNRLYQVSPTAAPKALIAYGQRVVGTLDATNSEARYTFTGNQNDEVRLQLIHQSDDALPILNIVDPANTVLATGQPTIGETRIEPYRLPADGFYTIVIKRPADAKQPYTAFALTLQVLNVPSGRTANGGVLNLNDSVLGSFVPGNAAQYWLFDAKAGQVISVNLLKLNGDLNPSVILISPTGQGLATFGLTVRENSGALSQFTLPSDGIYSLLVVPSGPNQGGQYRLTVQPNNNATAAPLALNAGQTVTGTIDASQPEQRWQVQGEAGQSLTARLLVTSGTLLPQIQLLSASGQVIAEGVEDHSLGLIGENLSTNIQEAGTYTIVIRQKFDAKFSAGTYRLMLEAGSLSPQAVAANPAVYGQAVSKATQQNATDYWSFNAAAGDNIVVSTAVAEGGKAPLISLQNEVGRVLAQSSNDEAADHNIDTFTIPTNGRYIVALRSQQTTPYKMVIQRRQSLLIENPPARPMIVGQALDGNLNNGDPIDYWTFEAKSGEVIQLDTVRLNGNIRSDVAIVAPSGAIVASGVSDRVGGNLRLGPIRVVEDGKYLIVVSRWLGPASILSGRYSLTLTKPTNVTGSDGGTIPTYGVTVTGAITADDPTDSWRFDGNAGEVLTIRATRLDGNVTPKLEIFSPEAANADASTKPLAAADGKDETAVIEVVTLPVNGTYTLKASAVSGQGGYKLIVERNRTAPQASVVGAAGIGFGETKSGELTQAVPSQAWVFFGHAGERVSLTAQSTATGTLDPYLTVIAPDGTTVGADDNSGGQNKSLLSSLLLPLDGFYGVVISGSPVAQGENQFGGFNVSLNRSEPGAAYQGTMQVGTAVEGTITADQPVQEWVFRADSSNSIGAALTAASGAFNGAISITSQDGKLIATSTTASNGTTSIDAELPGPGWYAVLVAANASGVQGRYQLKLDYALTPVGGGIIADGQTVTGTITNADFTHSWRFYAKANTTLNIDLKRITGDIDLDFTIYAPDGTQIPVEKVERSAIHIDGANFTAVGTYLLIVSRADGAIGRTTGSYQLGISVKK